MLTCPPPHINTSHNVHHIIYIALCCSLPIHRLWRVNKKDLHVSCSLLVLHPKHEPSSLGTTVLMSALQQNSCDVRHWSPQPAWGSPLLLPPLELHQWDRLQILIWGTWQQTIITPHNCQPILRSTQPGGFIYEADLQLVFEQKLWQIATVITDIHTLSLLFVDTNKPTNAHTRTHAHPPRIIRGRMPRDALLPWCTSHMSLAGPYLRWG